MTNLDRVLVTGANGHLGAHIVRELLQQGYEVVAMVRQGSNLKGLQGLDLAYSYGDVRDANAVRLAAQGCKAMIHTAAVYQTWSKNPNDIIASAIEGTRNAFAAAKATGLSKVVYTSSVNAVGYVASPLQTRSAKDWNQDARNPYYVAKTQSEREALALSEQLEIPTVRICPGAIIGPLDFKTTPSSQILLNLLHGGQTWEGGLAWVDVRDVAAAHVAALQRSQPGQRLIASSHNLHYRDLAKHLEALVGIMPSHLAAPRWMALAIAQTMEWSASLRNSRPRFSVSETYENVQRYGFFDPQNTWTDLGLTPKPFQQTLADTLRWFLQQGWLKPSVAQAVQMRLNAG